MPKQFIANAPLADLFVVFARTGKENYGTKGISVFLVEADLPGVIGSKGHKTGQAGAWTAEVFFDNVRVGMAALIGGQEGAGFGAAMKSLIRGRVHIAALCVGMAERIVEESVAYAAAGRQGGRPIGEFQLVRAMLAEIQTGVFAGRVMVVDAAEKYDSGEDRKLRPSATASYCSEMVSRAADLAVQIHGDMGYMRGTAVERCFRDAGLFRVFEGTSEIQKMITGRALLKDAQQKGAKWPWP
ncbi:acyl-CoA dehydrogenase family protein [Streptomyces aureus]|uniref:Acyl-CoA dehydrogenase family protein n=1 Tax=Streptomyces aureus TaxID=193461 RepID=A0ABV4SVX2_9ACTN